MTIIDLFKANESMKPMKLIQTPHQENTYNMSPYVSQHGIPAQMEINEVVSLLSSSPRKFNFLSEAPFIYELITMTLLATLKVHCPLCLKIIRCKLLLCHYINIIKSFYIWPRSILNYKTKQYLFNSTYIFFNVVLFKLLIKENHRKVIQVMMQFMWNTSTRKKL